MLKLVSEFLETCKNYLVIAENFIPPSGWYYYETKN